MPNVFIIAEAGVNHNGSLELAKKLVDVAVDAKADAVKFQTFNAEKLVSKLARKADYQKKTTLKNESQYELLKSLELDESSHIELLNYCEKKKIIFLSTPFDHLSIDLLGKLDLPIFKIPSGEITNLPYLKHIASFNKEIVLSTGMSYLSEIGDALNVLIGAGVSKDKITVLHATTEYPCPKDEVNLSAMLTIKNKFNVKVGYSDHTEGIEIPIAAAALGAVVIEKHFTLSRLMAGPDHLASVEPNELRLMISAIRKIEAALGDGIKKPTKSELRNMDAVRKSIVAIQDIKKGDFFSVSNIAVKRPGTGISPMRWDEVIGAEAKRDFLTDELIEL